MRRLLLCITVSVLVVLGLLLSFLLQKSDSIIVRRSAIFQDREVNFLIVPLSHAWRWELANEPTDPKTTTAWGEEKRASIVFNAAYFQEDRKPSGFFRVNQGMSDVPWPDDTEQKDVHGYTFLVQVEPHDIHLGYLPDTPRSQPETSSFLSFPTLIANGKPLVASDSQLYAERTILAEDANGADYLIQTEKGRVSLYEVAQWLAQQPEGFVMAGNLDGGPSTGIFLESYSDTFSLSSVAVPSVIMGYQE